MTHGHYKGGKSTPTYNSWAAMLRRTSNPRNDKWEYYGGRGIRVCKRWRTFEHFLADMGERPEGKTLDRRKVNGNYTPSNCRWATKQEQTANRRVYRLQVRGRTLTPQQALEIKAARQRGELREDIARQYNVSARHVSRICAGKSWWKSG